MAAIASRIRSKVDIPIGINALRNDGEAALSIAKASFAQFVRINIHMHSMLTDQGVIEGRSYETLRHRKNIDGENINIFTDINVKHAQPLVKPDIIQWTNDLILRGKSDAIIVSGSGTGIKAPIEELELVKSASSVPVFLGSGVTPENLQMYKPHSDGAIVGSNFKRDGNVLNPVDIENVKNLMDLI